MNLFLVFEPTLLETVEAAFTAGLINDTELALFKKNVERANKAIDKYEKKLISKVDCVGVLLKGSLDTKKLLRKMKSKSDRISD